MHIVASTLGFCVSALVLIARSSELHFTEAFVFLNTMCLTTVIMLVCFHYPATINSQCMVLKKKLSESVMSSQSKLIKKSARSLVPLRVHYTDSKFCRMTPMDFYKFSLKVAIKLALIEK